jgi:hypothetical protein
MDTMMGRSIDFHPQADIQTEVVNNTVVQLLQGYCNQHPKSWDDQLLYVQPMYNQVMYSFTQDSPVETCLGYLPKIPLDLLYGKDVRERDAAHKFIQRIQQVSQAVKEQDGGRCHPRSKTEDFTQE